MNKKLFTTCRGGQTISDQIETNLKLDDEFSNDDYEIAVDSTTIVNNGP